MDKDSNVCPIARTQILCGEKGSCFVRIWFTLYFSRMYQWRRSRATRVQHLQLNFPPVACPTTPSYNDALSSNKRLSLQLSCRDDADKK